MEEFQSNTSIYAMKVASDGKKEDLSNGVKMQYTRENWLPWLKQELRIKKELLPIKLISFMWSGGMAAFLPYLTLHMQEIGLTYEQIGIIYAVLPVSSLMGPPIAGLFADRTGKYKLVLLITMIMSAVMHTLLLLVPVVSKNPLILSCDAEGHTLSWASCHPCFELQNNTRQEMILEKCQWECTSPPAEFSICLHGDQTNSPCFNFTTTPEMSINGSLISRLDESMCSHMWYDVVHEEVIYQQLTCPSTCQMSCHVSGLTPCQNVDETGNITFWLYITIRMLAMFFMAPAFTMVDAAMLAVVEQYQGDFGKQRILATLGLGFTPLVAGFLVDYHSSVVGHQEYMSAFLLGDLFVIGAVIGASFITINVVDKTDNIMRDLKVLVSKFEIDVYFVMILILGSLWGYIENYLFVFLKELDAPNYMLGLTLTVGMFAGIPFLFLADPIVAKLGRPLIFMMSFFTYAIRMFGYSFLTNPWWCFPFELLEVVSYQLMWVAALTYCPLLAPKGLLATMTGLAGSVHYSVGRGMGAFMGGFLIANFGTKGGFQAMGYISIGGGVAYVLLHHCYFKQRIERDDKDEKEATVKNSEEAKPMLTKNQDSPKQAKIV